MGWVSSLEDTLEDASGGHLGGHPWRILLEDTRRIPWRTSLEDTFGGHPCLPGCPKRCHLGVLQKGPPGVSSRSPPKGSSRVSSKGVTPGVSSKGVRQGVLQGVVQGGHPPHFIYLSKLYSLRFRISNMMLDFKKE
jgi:hypothetical protein